MNGHVELPNANGNRYIVWTGMETDLMFNRGIDLPGFASFPLLEQTAQRKMLLDYALDQISLAAEFGLGTILESATWIANRDRAADLGYGPDRLIAVNRDAIALLVEAREIGGQADVLISANIGPRDDAYAPGETMTPDQAEAYHAVQVQSLVGTGVDVISAHTMSNSGEAVGIVRAARREGFPVVVAFTVETDGRLPSGQALDDAIAETDEATGNAAAYFMVNCAHPDHFSGVLSGNPRIGGVVVNASRCSHAELDGAEALDDGDPEELGLQVAQLVEQHRGIKVFGGCCGTDMRHLRAMARAVEAVQ